MIKFNGFTEEPAELKELELEAVRRVIESGHYVLGPEVTAFEEQWAAACGVKYAVGVGNGMDAIEIILRALGIGPGDEVITTPMTAVATVLAIVRAGATPVLADIDPETALLDEASVERCCSMKTKAVLLVHLYGQLKSARGWRQFCDARGILLIEDAAQAHLASDGAMSAGAFGVAGAFSFYPTKNLGALGDGGAVVTSDPVLDASVRQLRNYGQSTRYTHPVVGLNSRLDEIQAAILKARLPYLSGFTERRREIARRYHSEVVNPRIRLMAASATWSENVHHLFVVRTIDRARLQRYMEDKGIETLIHYPIPVHQQAAFRGIARDPIGLSMSERHGRECLSVPVHPQLGSPDVDAIVGALNGFE